jgi:hypothetical protein
VATGLVAGPDGAACNVVDDLDDLDDEVDDDLDDEVDDEVDDDGDEVGDDLVDGRAGSGEEGGAGIRRARAG